MTIGKHIVLDVYDVSNDIFKKLDSNYKDFHNYIKKSLKSNKMTLIKSSYKNFSNNIENKGAFTSLYLLSESHLSFHTWPEHNYIAIDCFTCGNCDPEKIIDDILEYLKSTNFKKQIIIRGHHIDKYHDYENKSNFYSI